MHQLVQLIEALFMKFLEISDVNIRLHVLDVFNLKQEALHDVCLAAQLRVQRLQDALDDHEHKLGLHLDVLLCVLQPIESILLLLTTRVVKVAVHGRRIVQGAPIPILPKPCLKLIMELVAVKDCAIFDVLELLLLATLTGLVGFWRLFRARTRIERLQGLV